MSNKIFVRESYPDLSFYNSSKYKLIISLAQAFFLYLFLIVFVPFGVDNYNPKHETTLYFLTQLFIFPAEILVFSLINEFLIRPLIFKKLSYRRILFWAIWTCVLLSLTTFLFYNIMGNWHDMHLSSAVEFIFNCTSILIFPQIGTFFFFRYKTLQQHFYTILTDRNQSIEDNPMITFAGQGSNDLIVIAATDFIYAQAQDNYVKLYYLLNNQVRKFLIRSSMTNLLESISNPAIIRCHRSYLINLFHVKSIQGGMSNLKLFLSHLDKDIPVSKSYQKTILERLEERNIFLSV